MFLLDLVLSVFIEFVLSFERKSDLGFSSHLISTLMPSHFSPFPAPLHPKQLYDSSHFKCDRPSTQLGLRTCEICERQVEQSSVVDPDAAPARCRLCADRGKLVAKTYWMRCGTNELTWTGLYVLSELGSVMPIE